MSTSHQRTLLLGTIAVVIVSVAAQCTLPSNLRGAWVRGRDKKTLTFNVTHVSGLDIVVSGVTYSVFDCYILEGTVLVVRTSDTYQVAISNDDARLYTCWDLRQVDTTNYYMYERTTEASYAGGARVVTLVEGTTVTSSDVCESQASAVPFFALVKSGAAFQQTCSDVIRGKYNYTYTNYASVTSCTGDSLLDVCSDVSKPTFDYTKCSQQMMGSSGGVFSCLAAVTSGAYEFVLLYNEQASDSAIFSCVIIDQQADTTYMSYRPDYCDPSMSPTTAPSSGGTFVLKHLELCPYTTTAAQTTPSSSASADSTGAIAGAVVAVAIVALIAVIVGVVVYKKRQLRIKSTPNTPMNPEGGDKVAKGEANSNGSAHANGNANGKTPDGQPQSDKVTTTSETNGDVPKEGDETPRRLPPLSNGTPLEGEAVSPPDPLPPISGT